jgi:hypothetical protein
VEFELLDMNVEGKKETIVATKYCFYIQILVAYEYWLPYFPSLALKG